MLEKHKKSNAQQWELEVTCKNRNYLNAVVKAILKQGLIDFQVESVEGCYNSENVWVGRYLVFMTCSWFNNLHNITKELVKIERKFND